MSTQGPASHSALIDIAGRLSIRFRDGTPPQDGFVAANGIRFHYVDWGGAAKRPILFLHGGAQTAHTWDLVCLGLRDDYRCIALDQRAHGESEGLFRFDVDEPREDLEGVVHALGLRDFVLVGMSLGGNNAIAYAGRNSSSLAGVVFVDVSPVVTPDGYRDNAAIGAAVRQAPSFDEAAEAAYRLNPRGSRDFKRYALGYCVEQTPSGSWRLKTEARSRAAGIPAEHAANMARRREQLWAETASIACPCLVVHGADSRAQTAESMQRFCEVLPDARLTTIAGASHYVQEDEPRALTQAIRAFLHDIAY